MGKISSDSPLINGLLYVGGLLALQFLISTLQIGVLSILSFAITAFIVYLLYKITAGYRDEYCDGAISYGKAFMFIFRMYFLGSVISAFVMFIYSNFINREFLALLMEETLKMYEMFSLQVNDTTYALLEIFFKPLSYALLQLFGNLLTAVFWALIVSAFVKKSKDIFS
jgi:hypothetical protein